MTWITFRTELILFLKLIRTNRSLTTLHLEVNSVEAMLPTILLPIETKIREATSS
jgi:hypothetical protein